MCFFLVPPVGKESENVSTMADKRSLSTEATPLSPVIEKTPLLTSPDTSKNKT